MITLSDRERERYRRQLMHEGYGLQQQERLRASTAVIAGVGGLGGAAATYLAVAGIGGLRLAHAGDLTLSNMNRQTLMRDDHIGKSRVEQAQDRIRMLNPDVAVEIFNERITSGNTGMLLDRTDIALSARPNFPERRILNEACIRQEIPMVEAAMNGMDGYLFTVMPGATPCLDCVFPEHDPTWEELGFPVFGAVSGMLGCMMALEAIKVLTGYGRPLGERMLVFNAYDMVFRNVKIRFDPDCPVCGGKMHRSRLADSSIPTGRTN
jgi:molybdopterin-synthase adenylyltransferase